MKVILREDIPKLGRRGDTKVIAEGYARNYLVPRNLVMEATPVNIKIWEKEKVKYEKIRQQDVEKSKELAANIEKLSLTIPVKVGEAGKLFGSVTSAHIADALKANGFSIDKHDIILPEPLKEVGVYSVEIRIHSDVSAKAKVWVVEQKPE